MTMKSSPSFVPKPQIRSPGSRFSFLFQCAFDVLHLVPRWPRNLNCTARIAIATHWERRQQRPPRNNGDPPVFSRLHFWADIRCADLAAPTRRAVELRPGNAYACASAGADRGGSPHGTRRNWRSHGGRENRRMFRSRRRRAAASFPPVPTREHPQPLRQRHA